jgi:hypothetical protein
MAYRSPESQLQDVMQLMRRRIPEFAALPEDKQRAVIIAAKKKLKWSARDKLEMTVRLFLPTVIVFGLIHFLKDLYWFCGLLLVAITLQIILGMQFYIGLLVPSVRAELRYVCGSCGYNLTGNLSGICPECGAVIPIGS